MRLRYMSSDAPPPASVNTKVTRATGRDFANLHVVLGVVVGVAGIVLAFLLYFWTKRFCIRKRRNRYSIRVIELRRFDLDEIEKATACFSKECLVGSGAFGNVYKGVFDEDGFLAVKRAHADSYESVHEFRNEVQLLSKVQHPNLVNLVGYCQEADQKILVYEYVPHGSLLEYLFGRRKRTFTWRQRAVLAIGAAKGIAHLHEGVNPSIIHRDIKPSNILVGEDFEAKVSDFGLVKLGPVGDESHVSSQIKGTPGYLDPDYCSSFHLTPFSDVYSFGVILLQLISARPAVDNSRQDTQYHIIDWAKPSLERGIVEEIMDANLLLEACNMEIMLKMGQLALRCVAKTPKDRPTMSQVVQELEEALNQRVSFASQISSSTPTKKSVTQEESHSFSIDGVKLQRLHMETDDISIHDATIGCFRVNSTSIDNVSNAVLVEMRKTDTGCVTPSTPPSEFLKLK